MEKKSSRKLLWASLLLTPLLLVAPASAAGEQDSIGWNVSTGGMDWSILIPENGSILTVGGNGVNYRKVFRAGEKPRFSTGDIEGNLADGTYKWELRVAPRGVEPVDDTGLNNGRDGGQSTTRQLPVRSRIERKQFEKSLVRSGAFTVLNGGILDPNQVEPGTLPSNGAEGQGANK